MWGFTLMNNPARVEDRVGAVNRMDVDYDEISEALGEDPGYFDVGRFAETKSTHYGRMIYEDDRTIMFANLQDAAG
jgi:propane monooxygenase coupling protein